MREMFTESARVYCQLTVGCGATEPCANCVQTAKQVVRLFGSLLPDEMLDRPARDLFATVHAAGQDA